MAGPASTRAHPGRQYMAQLHHAYPPGPQCHAERSVNATRGHSVNAVFHPNTTPVIPASRPMPLAGPPAPGRTPDANI